MPDRPMLSVIAVVFSLTAVACAGGATSNTATAPTSTVTTSTPGTTGPKPTKTTASPAVEVPELLDFEAPLLDGGTFRGADVAGKDVAFWFWAPW
jgi:hypothetical protein